MWVNPKSADVLRAARLRTVGEYISRRRQTVLRAIADRPILEECREAERQRGSPTCLYWWEQEFEEELELMGVDEEKEAGWLTDCATWRSAHHVGRNGGHAHLRPPPPHPPQYTNESKESTGAGARRHRYEKGLAARITVALGWCGGS